MAFPCACGERLTYSNPAVQEVNRMNAVFYEKEGCILIGHEAQIIVHSLCRIRRQKTRSKVPPRSSMRVSPDPRLVPSKIGTTHFRLDMLTILNRESRWKKGCPLPAAVASVSLAGQFSDDP